ncbi:MAG: hypothetical protein HKM07_05805 [Chlamydiae bacterium]|nr:hypothetical protein [Chlamydiota bacterium]
MGPVKSGEIRQVWCSTGQPSTIANALQVEHKERIHSFTAPFGKKGVKIELYDFDEKADLIKGKYTNLDTLVSSEVEFTKVTGQKGKMVFVGKPEGAFERVRWYLTVPRNL